MGFTSGFAGGVTLTLGFAYLTVLAHNKNRQSQALYLRSQSQLLTTLVDPVPVSAPLSRNDLIRESRSSFVETAKDRWNGEIENAVRKIQHADWDGVREGMEGAVARLWGGGLQKSREGIEQAKEDVGLKRQETTEYTKVTAKTAEGLDHVVVNGKDAVKATIQKNHGLVDEARKDASNMGAGTVDAAREAVRGVVSKGIEKGKKVIGKASESVESRISSVSPISDVEKALQERYEKPSALAYKTVEQVLAERYNPIDQQGGKVLRGV